jgi:hypothetical protein
MDLIRVLCLFWASILMNRGTSLPLLGASAIVGPRSTTGLAPETPMPSRSPAFTLFTLLLLFGCARQLPPSLPGPGVNDDATTPSRFTRQKPEHAAPHHGSVAPVKAEPPALARSLALESAPPPPGYVAPRPSELLLAPADKTCAEARPSLDPGLRMKGNDIPGGADCLTLLDQLGVRYGKFDEAGRLLVLRGDLGGIHYRGLARAPLVAECRLILALYRVAPILERAGVTEVGYSGAYSYRLSRTGRLSLHAYGLALDVHQMVVDGRLVRVERDFRRGLTACPCPAEPALNRVACALRGVQVFRELLTPDYNIDHHDHFHLGIAPLSSERPAPVLARSYSVLSKRAAELAAQTTQSHRGGPNRPGSLVRAPAPDSAPSHAIIARRARTARPQTAADPDRGQRVTKLAATHRETPRVTAPVRAEPVPATTEPTGPVLWETSDQPLHETRDNPEHAADSRRKSHQPSVEARLRAHRKVLRPKRPILTRASHTDRVPTTPPGETERDSSSDEWN